MSKRIKNSIGQTHLHEGICFELNCEKYAIDNSRKYFLFDVIPQGKPRMTRQDKWRTNPNHADPNRRQRKCVTEYWNYKNKILWQAKPLGFEMYDFLVAVYILPMPNSWSAKKKERENGLPCRVKPDTDNITKGLKDIFNINDSHVWWEKAEKRWGYFGSILLYA